jgi:hypothetical protein
MSAASSADRIELSPTVRAILTTDSPKSQFLQHYLRYLEALLTPDLADLDSVVTREGRFHELEAMGLPPGLEGLKMFRRQVNAAIPDEHILLTAVRFEGGDIIEADMVMEATQTGEISVYPQQVGKSASKSTSDADSSVASWLNDGRKSTLKASSASLPAPFNRPPDET